MTKSTLPFAAIDILLQDAIQRDITTARRVALLELLWNERYLTRAQLIARVELRLGRGCFGSSAWQDTFYRDMRVVKKALDTADFPLLYSRNKQQPGAESRKVVPTILLQSIIKSYPPHMAQNGCLTEIHALR